MNTETVEAPVERGVSGLHIADERFVHEWLNNGYNAKKAVLVVWPDTKPANAEAKGKAKLMEPVIAAYASGVVKAHLDAYEVTEKRILEELSTIAFFDPICLVEQDGSVKNRIQDIPEKARRAVSQISENIEGKITLKLANKEKALELLGKTLKMFTDVSEVKTEDLASAIRKARTRKTVTTEVEELLE